MQSAYRKHLSTETALLQVVNDIHQATDNNWCEAVLVMLDLSVGFDTIDHAILLDRLGYCYGFFEMVFRWIESHLKDRPQCIALDKIFSPHRYMSCGVPQASLLGPLVFSLYIASHHQTVSTQWCILTTPSSTFLCVTGTTPLLYLENLSLWLDDIMSWNLCNMLKCNPSKTENTTRLNVMITDLNRSNRFRRWKTRGDIYM